MNSLWWPFDTSGFVPRWRCGLWSDELGWLHIVSDSLIWLAYLAIPAVLVYFLRRRRDMPFPRIIWLFDAFIVACGTTHLIEAIIFWFPVYRLAGLAKLLTAVISWITVIALVPIIPRALAMRTPTDLENEVAARTTELTEANAALQREVQERLRVVESLRMRDRAISAANQGILITDATHPENPIIYANAGFERITGYTADEVIGVNCRFLQGTESDPNAVRRIRESIAAAEPCTVEIVNYRKDGTPFWNELSISPVRDDRGQLTHFVGVQADTSMRRKLEDQLLQSQKMESVGRLAGGVAHDFNNMLTIITGCSELVLTSLPPNDPAAPLLNEIKSAGERAADLTRQLLTFSRRQLVAPEILDLNQVVSNTEKMLGRLLGEDIHVLLRLESGVWPIQADRGQMQQVLLNLALNARDAMPHGGDLSISTRNVQIDDEYMKLNLEAHSGPHVVLEVSDTGLGLDDEAKARLFEPFFTTKATGSGTGLGLAVVHGIVIQSGGHIEVTSEQGQGTVFRVCLPQATNIRGVSTHRTLETSELPTGTETILVVEDETGVRALVRNVLAQCGYNVMDAADGEEAVALAKSCSSPIDLLLTDVVMPGAGGSRIASEILSNHKAARVLFISGYTDDEVLRHGVMHDKVEFLEKPFTPSTLARKVREVLDKSE